VESIRVGTRALIDVPWIVGAAEAVVDEVGDGWVHFVVEGVGADRGACGEAEEPCGVTFDLADFEASCLVLPDVA